MPLISLPCAIILLFATPLRLALHIPLQGIWEGIEITCSALLLISIVLRWHRAGTSKPSAPWVLLSLLGAVPVELLFDSHGIFLLVASSLRLLNLVHLFEFPSLAHKLEHAFPHIAIAQRLTTSLVGAGFLAHWISCGWIAISDFNSEAGPLETYTAALYWAITTMATIGYGDIVPHTILERWFAMGVMVIGVGSFGYIIGNIATILADLDRIGALHREKLEQARTYMRYHKFPRDLRKRVEEYYQYQFDHRLGFEDEQFLTKLPNSLRAEMAVFMHRELLRKVPFLHSAHPKVVERLAFRLKPLLMRPHDTIFRRGDSGDRMYFINHGSVEILGPEDKGIVATLTEGSFFGEMALLAQEPRNATARAQDFCELVYLDHTALQEVMERFPEFSEEIHRVAKQRSL
jgi:voltage-gated potassium channel